MGAGATAPLDAAAVPDGEVRAMTVAEARAALFDRLHAILRLVRRMQVSGPARRGSDGRFHSRLDRLEDEIIDLMEDADYVVLTTLDGSAVARAAQIA